MYFDYNFLENAKLQNLEQFYEPFSIILLL